MITQITNGLIWYTCGIDEIAWNGTCYLSLLYVGEFPNMESYNKTVKEYIGE